MWKDISLEGKAFIMSSQRKGAFSKRKIYQAFPQDKRCDLRLCPVDHVSLKTVETALGLSAGPLPVGTRQPFTNGLQPFAGRDADSQSPHIYLAPCGSPRYHFSVLGFVDAVALLANNSNKSMVSHP